MVTGTISSANRPASCAAAQRCWLRSAKASWSARETPKSRRRRFVAGLRHRIDAVLLLHRRVDEAPADRGVVDGVRPREGGLGLGHHERRARHLLRRPAGDHQVAIPRADRRVAAWPTASIPDRKKAVIVRARHVHGQAGEQTPPCARRCGCPRPPGWRTVDQVVDLRPVHRTRCVPRAPSAAPAARSSARTEDSRPAVAADGRADGVADEGASAERSGMSEVLPGARGSGAFIGRAIVDPRR